MPYLESIFLKFNTSNRIKIILERLNNQLTKKKRYDNHTAPSLCFLTKAPFQTHLLKPGFFVLDNNF